MVYRWNENWQGKLNYSEKTRPNAIFPLQIPHDLGSNPGHLGGKPASDLNNGTASYISVSQTFGDREPLQMWSRTSGPLS
jgi:hypothetical protein